MLKVNFIRKNIESVVKNLNKRNYFLNKNYFNFLYNKKKELKTYLEYLYKNRNQNNKQYVVNNEKNTEQKKLKKITSQTEEDLRLITEEFTFLLKNLPNVIHSSVGLKDNVITEYFVSLVGGENENEVGLTYESLLIKQKDNIKKAIEMSGTKFIILRGSLCRLKRSLCQYMLDLHTTEHGYTELYVPFLLKGSALTKSCHLPKFVDDQFKIDSLDLWLNPTGEVPLVNYINGMSFIAEQLPLNLVCHTTCFRKEAGSYGKKTQGLLRQHQFEKVELVRVVTEKNSYKQLDTIVKHACAVLVNLGLQHRVVCLGANNTGCTSSKTYDIDVWYAHTKKYVEVSSCSNTETYQTNELNATIKHNDKINSTKIHILNGSGLAVSRVFYAILEKYQTKDGKFIRIPDVLKKYINKDYLPLD